MSDLVPPTREDGPAWSSPTDGSDRGWPDGRYIVAFEIDGVTEEDCRKATLPEARARRYLLHGELSRMGHLNLKVVIWDAEDKKRRDLATEQAEDQKPPSGQLRARVLPETKAEIIRRWKAGEKRGALADAFGLSRTTIDGVLNNRPKGGPDAEGD